MKITIVTETSLPFIAGVSSSTDSIANFLDSRGHDVTLIAPNPVLPFSPPKESKIKFVFTPSFKDPFHTGKPTSPLPLPLPSVIKQIKRETTNIVHIQEPGAVGLGALFVAKSRKIPIVGALYSTPEQCAKFIPWVPQKLFIKEFEKYLSWFYNSCNAIMVLTSTFAKTLKKIGVQKNIVVVSNGVETKKFLPGPQNKQIIKFFNLPKDKILFFYLGRLSLDKNIETILKALLFTSDKVHLVVAGQGQEEEKLKEIAEKLKVEEKISWIGFIPEEKIVQAYQTMDCFVLMSLFEVQSIVTLQAVATGLPVLAAKAGALPELVKDGINGYLVKPHDYKTLAEKMNIIAKDRALRKKMGKESRKIPLPHEKTIVLQKLEDLYKSLLKE